jgi:hypothetical protein
MSLTKKAMVARLDFSIIGMKRKDQSATIKSNNALQTTQEAGHYQKCRVSSKNIKDVLDAKSRAMQVHKEYTTPFTNDRWRLIGAEFTMAYSQEMSDLKQEFYMAVDDVVNRWPAIVADEKNRLGPLFNQNEYPTQAEVRGEFEFNHQLKPVLDVTTCLDHLALTIEEQVLEEIKENLQK